MSELVTQLPVDTTKKHRFSQGQLVKHRISPPHPLDSTSYTDEGMSDSETDMSIDSSYNCSIMSNFSNDSVCVCSPFANCCTISPPTIRPSTTLPSTQASFVAATSPSASWSKTSYCDDLAALLRRSTPSVRRPRTQKKQTRLITYNRLHTFLALFFNYPGDSSDEKHAQRLFAEEAADCWPLRDDFDSTSAPGCYEEELTTFANSGEDFCNLVTRAGHVRNRESRINSGFLLRYALDSSCRNNGVLPGDAVEMESTNRRKCLHDFDQKHGLVRYSEMSREKLWNCVILPPRRDPYPRTVIDYDQYSYVHDEANGTCSIATKKSNQLPWAAHQSTVKPAGRLKTSSIMESKNLPTLSPSVPQFTLKGWQNERWIPVE